MDPTKAIYNLVGSMIRTIGPKIVAGLVGWLAVRWGVIVDEDTQAGLIILFSGVLFGIYYFLVRMGEQYISPHFAWFLLDFRKGISAPVYPKAIETTIVPPRDPGGD